MPEYIEREALIEELEEELAFDTPMYTDEENKFINRGLKIAIKDVNSIPTADVAEVKHGEWKLDVHSFYVDTYSEESELGVYIYATCSNCGKPHQTNGYSGQVFSKTVYAPEGQERGYKFDQNYEEFKAIEEFRKRNYKFTNYCPNCGAKMDKE